MLWYLCRYLGNTQTPRVVTLIKFARGGNLLAGSLHSRVNIATKATLLKHCANPGLVLVEVQTHGLKVGARKPAYKVHVLHISL